MIGNHPSNGWRQSAPKLWFGIGNEIIFGRKDNIYMQLLSTQEGYELCRSVCSLKHFLNLLFTINDEVIFLSIFSAKYIIFSRPTLQLWSLLIHWRLFDLVEKYNKPLMKSKILFFTAKDCNYAECGFGYMNVKRKEKCWSKASDVFRGSSSILMIMY